jgi:hypothetical protein
MSPDEVLDGSGMEHLSELKIRNDGSAEEIYDLEQTVDGVPEVLNRKISADKNKIVYERTDGSEITASRTPDGTFVKRQTRGPDHDLDGTDLEID